MLLVSKLKAVIKRHRRLCHLARKILRRKTSPVIYSWTDIDMMVDDWCRFLPRNFDCVIGVPREGLIIADKIAINFGLPLSTPEDFINGVYWQSRWLPLVEEIRRVLVVDDSAHYGRDLVYAVQRLRHHCPNVKFESAVLVRHAQCKLNLNYYYCTDETFSTQGNYPLVEHLSSVRLSLPDLDI